MSEDKINYKNTAEVATQLTAELQLEVNESQIRRYTEVNGIIPVKRGELNDYRLIDPTQIKQLKVIVVLYRLGVTTKDISDFINKTLTAESFKAIYDKITLFRTTLALAERVISEYTFPK